MPFTPFHFGPGAFIKSLMPRWFSLRVFLLSQVIMDMETAWNILQGNERLHTFFHSYIGSIAVIIFTLILVYVYNFIYLQALGRQLLASSIWRPFEKRATLIAAFIGAWSHVFLDGIMHMDMAPMIPFSGLNPTLGLISVFTLHLTCLFGFILAAAVYGIRFLIRTSTRLAARPK